MVLERVVHIRLQFAVYFNTTELRAVSPIQNRNQLSVWHKNFNFL